MSATLCLALAIFLESGIENDTGKIATGWSVVNSSRTLHDHPVKVCKEVFSGRYMAVNNMREKPAGKEWKHSIHIARQILNNKVPDITKGAQYFECTRWRSCANPPWWSKGMEYAGMFGSQKFYREVTYDKP